MICMRFSRQFPHVLTKNICINNSFFNKIVWKRGSKQKKKIRKETSILLILKIFDFLYFRTTLSSSITQKFRLGNSEIQDGGHSEVAAILPPSWFSTPQLKKPGSSTTIVIRRKFTYRHISALFCLSTEDR